MDFTEEKREIRKTAASELTKKAVALALLLAAVLLWWFIPLVRDRIWPGLTKWHLTGLLGISATINLGLLLAYLLKFRPASRQRQDALAQAIVENIRLKDLIHNPPRIFKFGVWWDKDGIPYCPMDKEMPLGNWVAMMHDQSAYHCPMHNHFVPLKDDNGNLMTPTEARARLSPDYKEEPKELVEGAQSLDLNEGDKRLLFHLAKNHTGRDLSKMAEELRLDAVVAQYHADRLRARGLISRKRSARRLKEYALTNRGIKYVTENKPDLN